MLVRGTKESGAVNAVIVAIKVAVDIFFIIIGVQQINVANYHLPAGPLTGSHRSRYTGLATPTRAFVQRAGIPLEAVSQRLGHASIGITAERYLHIYSERDAEAAKAFAQRVG